ncbi:MAG: PIN domain-containing protein [Ferruginibacter sp.]
MKIVVDSNLIFSILLKHDGKTAFYYFPLKKNHQLYISDYTFEEITKHTARLIRISKLSLLEFETQKFRLLQNVQVVPVSILPNQLIEKAYELVRDIDLDDLPFIATTLFINGILWTGDRALIRGLHKKNFKNIVDTEFIKNIKMSL